LLFGEHYFVKALDQEGKWMLIKNYFDHYEGWIDAKQHNAITKEYFDHILNADFKITTDVTSSLLYKKSPIHILIGSIIPVTNTELFKIEEQLAFNGEAKAQGQRRDYEFLKSIALKYLNSPYQWGGKSPFGIDCSGFVQMVFKISGFKMHRDAWQQAENGERVTGFDQAKPGDLAFFKNESAKISHVGIVLENQQIIHASGKVRIDQLTEQGIMHAESKQITHQLSHLNRLLPEH
ncbi:MAG TPA: C40 family peptidase, partial [Cyclobacteriaceae bacterium]|nr:C40 family peptidase [Cyclobacteriaceae bacterium]